MMRWREIGIGLRLAVMLTVSMMGPALTAFAQSDQVSLNIPPQELAPALAALAEQANMQILYASELAGSRMTKGAVGTMTPEEAVRKVLEGTGLQYVFTDAKTVTLQKAIIPVNAAHAEPSGTSELPAKQKPVKVPEIVVKEVRERTGDTSYLAEGTSTATKSDIPLIETPQSISVVTRKRMVDQEVNTIAEALRYMPGVQAESNGYEPRFTWLKFRGFDNTTNGLFKDGLQLRNPAFAVSYNLEPYGAEQIDVLRGPASFLYGQGSPGGLLNYVSKRPTQESLHEVQALSGNFGRNEGRFDFGGRVDDSDVLSYRLTALFRDSGTQIDNVPNGRVYIAPALTWRIAPSTSATFFASYQKDRLGMSQGLPVSGTLRSSLFGNVDPNRFVGLPGVDRYNRQEHSLGYELNHRLADNWTFLQKFRYNSTETDDVATFAYPLGSPLPALDRAQQLQFGKLTAIALDNQVGGKINTGAFQHTILGGVDFQRIRVRARTDFAIAETISNVFERYNYGGASTIPLPGLSNNQYTTQFQTGVYVQDQVKYDNWLLTFGGRHDWTNNTTANNLTGVKTSQDDRKATGRAALTYLFESGFAPYASYSTFFLPSLGQDANGNAFKPETGRQYEAGIKYQPKGSRSFVTAAIFDLTRENYVQTDPGTFLPVQRGKVRSRGLELEGVASFDSGLDVIASYTILDNQVRETADPAEQGKRLPQTASQFGSLWAKYTVPEGRLKGLGIGGGARYTGNSHADTGNAFRVPGFVVGDAMLDYTWNHYRFALNVSNLFNQDAFACFDRGGSNYCTFGERRTVVGTVAYRW